MSGRICKLIDVPKAATFQFKDHTLSPYKKDQIYVKFGDEGESVRFSALGSTGKQRKGRLHHGLKDFLCIIKTGDSKHK